MSNGGKMAKKKDNQKTIIDDLTKKRLMDFEFPQPSEAALLAEHQTAQDFALQADSISWQIGSILIGGSLLFLSVLGEKNIKPYIFYGGILLVNLILMCWILFFQGQYQIKRFKLYRICEIERGLGLKQNYYWDKGRSYKDPHHGLYRTYGPSGVDLALFLYIIISFGNVIFGIVKLFSTPNFYFFLWGKLLFISFIIPIFTIFWYYKNAKEFKDYIESNP